MSLKEITSYQSGNNVFGAYRKFNSLIPLAGVEHYKSIKVFKSWYWEAELEGDFLLTTINYCHEANAQIGFILRLFKRESHNGQNYDIPIWNSAMTNYLATTPNFHFGANEVNIPIQNQKIVFTNDLNSSVPIIYFELILKTVSWG